MRRREHSEEGVLAKVSLLVDMVKRLKKVPEHELHTKVLGMLQPIVIEDDDEPSVFAFAKIVIEIVRYVMHRANTFNNA